MKAARLVKRMEFLACLSDVETPFKAGHGLQLGLQNQKNEQHNEFKYIIISHPISCLIDQLWVIIPPKLSINAHPILHINGG